jgi:putative acetyltransferase
MDIRKLESKDEKQVKDLILSILGSEYPFDKKTYSDSDLNLMHETYSGKREAFFVLEEDGTVIGTIGVKEEGPLSALIRRFFVGQEHRGKGYGKQLIAKAIEFCRSKEYKHIVFQGTGRMIQAIELCKKAGFKEKERLDMGGFFIFKFVLDL